MLSKPVQQFWDTLILEQQQVDGKSYEEDLDFVLNTFDAACIWISSPSWNACIICSSSEIDDNTLNSI